MYSISMVEMGGGDVYEGKEEEAAVPLRSFRTFGLGLISSEQSQGCK